VDSRWHREPVKLDGAAARIGSASHVCARHKIDKNATQEASRLEKSLADDMDAIRAWLFLMMLAFSLIFTLSGGGGILRGIMRLAGAFSK
jgi:hypothetical protein